MFIGYLYTDKTVSMIAVMGMDGWKERKKEGQKERQTAFFCFWWSPTFPFNQGFWLGNDLTVFMTLRLWSAVVQEVDWSSTKQ